MMSFSEKNAVVTGGSGGIGFEVCKLLLENDIKSIAIFDLEENSESITSLRADHPTKVILFVKTDVADKKAVEAAYEEIMKSFDYLDIVINIAGIFNDMDVSRTINVNIGGIINSTFAAMAHMSKDKGGRGGIIANMSSVVGLDPFYIMPVYTSTKHAIVGFTRCLSNDYYFERTGIKFLILCPGVTITQLSKHKRIMIGRKAQSYDTLDEMRKSSIFHLEYKNFKDKIIYPEMCDAAHQVLDRLHKQSPHDVSKCIITAINESENGAIWIIENKQMHPITMTRYWRSIEEKM